MGLQSQLKQYRRKRPTITGTGIAGALSNARQTDSGPLKPAVKRSGGQSIDSMIGRFKNQARGQTVGTGFHAPGSVKTDPPELRKAAVLAQIEKMSKQTLTKMSGGKKAQWGNLWREKQRNGW